MAPGVAGWSIEDEPARGHFAAPGFLREPGLRRIRRYVSGEVKAPAIQHLTGLAMTHAAPGRCTVALPASRWLASSIGTVQGGVAAFVADAPLSAAVETELEPGLTVTTAQLSFHLVRPATPGGRIVADASTTHVGRNLGLSSCAITDGSGRLLGRGIARNVIVEVGDSSSSDLEQPPVDEGASYQEPDPWQRPVNAETFEGDFWDRPGIELIEGLANGSLPAPPFSVLGGFSFEAFGEGWVEFSAPTSAWWCSPAFQLYGGMLAVFAESSLSGAFLTVTPAARVPATVDLNVRFHRPVFPNTGRLRARAETSHVGRTLLVARCEVQSPDGRTAMMVEGSASLVPPRVLIDT